MMYLYKSIFKDVAIIIVGSYNDQSNNRINNCNIREMKKYYNNLIQNYSSSPPLIFVYFDHDFDEHFGKSPIVSLTYFLWLRPDAGHATKIHSVSCTLYYTKIRFLKRDDDEERG